jgi:hypothetical protein
MKAVAYKNALPITDADALIDIDLPAPVALGRDLLVRVMAVSVNLVDRQPGRAQLPEDAGNLLELSLGGKELRRLRQPELGGDSHQDRYGAGIAPAAPAAMRPTLKPSWNTQMV